MVHSKSRSGFPTEAQITGAAGASAGNAIEIDLLGGSSAGQINIDGNYGEGWINGGFFVLQPEVVNYIEGDHTGWEFESLEKIAAIGQLAAYPHEGFWQSMDTLRDVNLLEKLWREGNAPWKLWN